MNKASRAPLLIIFVTVFIDLLGFGIVLPLLPRYAEHFRVTDWTLGLLMASFSAMQFLFAPFWGWISDRVGRRPILILGLAGSTLFYTLFGYATSLGVDGQLLGLSIVPWLFLCRIGAGIAGATIPTAQAYIADVTGPKERAKGMALIGMAFGIGFTFGPLLGAGFVSGELGDVQTLMQSDGIAADLKITSDQKQAMQPVLAQLEADLTRGDTVLNRGKRKALRREANTRIESMLTPEQKEEWVRQRVPSSAPGYVAGVLSGLALLSSIFLLPESRRPDAAVESRHWLDLASLRQAVARPAIALVLLTMFLTTFAFAQFESTLALLTEHLGLADKYNYFVFAYIGFVLSLSQGFLVRRLVPKWGEFVMCVVGTVLMVVGLLLVGFAGMQASRPLLYAVLPISVIGFSALTPSLQSLLSRHTAASSQGGILGLGQSMSAMARILGPVVGIPLIYRDIGYPYWVGAAIMVCGVFLTLGLRKPPLDAAAVVPEPS